MNPFEEALADVVLLEESAEKFSKLLEDQVHSLKNRIYQLESEVLGG